MDGKTLLHDLRQLLQEDEGSLFLDTFTSYRFLNEAAEEFVRRTKICKATQSITTVADQAAYDLNADFIECYLRDRDNRLIVKINDGINNYFIPWIEYTDLIYDDRTATADAKAIPDAFSIIDKSTLDTRITGTASADGAVSGGQCTLTDTTGGDFTDVEAGDIVHNTTDGSRGIVLSKTSSTVLVTALFGGTNADWTNNDAYVIQPQQKWQIVFTPPTDVAAYTVTVYYVQRPGPVYSDYGMWRIPAQYMTGIVKYAAWLYKYREGAPNTGNAWFQAFENQIQKVLGVTTKLQTGNQMRVSFKQPRPWRGAR